MTPPVRLCPFCGLPFEVVGGYEKDENEGYFMMKHNSPECPLDCDGQSGTFWNFETADPMVAIYNKRFVEDELMQSLLDAAYNAGKEKGQNLLMQLAEGDLSVMDFNKKVNQKEGR